MFLDIRPQLLKGWIHCINATKTYWVTHWRMVHPMVGTIHPLNNWGLDQCQTILRSLHYATWKVFSCNSNHNLHLCSCYYSCTQCCVSWVTFPHLVVVWYKWFFSGMYDVFLLSIKSDTSELNLLRLSYYLLSKSILSITGSNFSNLMYPVGSSSST